jgi:putative transposase
MRAFKYKLKPSPRVARIFEQWLSVCRELYNAGLAERRDAWRTARHSITFEEQSAQLPDIRRERKDVEAVNAQVLQEVLKRLDRAYRAFFRRVKAGKKPGFPRFRGKGRYTSFTFPQAKPDKHGKGCFRVEGRYLHLSKIGRVKMFLSRPIEGRIKTCTIKREADGWCAVFACEVEPSEPLPATGERTGVDLGIERFATLSSGEMVENPRFLKQAGSKLKTARRALSRKKKGGKNWEKARRQLARKHQKVARCRRDFHHKTSLYLVRRFDGTAFENLKIAGLMKNHHLAKAIADVGWNAFLKIHFAKAESAGRDARKVPAAFSSQDCSRCGGRVRKTLAQRRHICIECGLELHRDHNAAINLEVRAWPAGMGESPRANREPTPPRRGISSHPS